MTTSSLRRKTHAQQTSQQTLARARRILRRRLPELRQACGVQALWLFGSYVRGEARQQSDLDLLVQFDDRSTLSLLEFIALENRLSDWLSVPVDLVEKSGLKPAIGRHVLQEAVPV
jgi:predicted nucleotidyltransferase